MNEENSMNCIPIFLSVSVKISFLKAIRRTIMSTVFTLKKNSMNGSCFRSISGYEHMS